MERFVIANWPDLVWCFQEGLLALAVTGYTRERPCHGAVPALGAWWHLAFKGPQEPRLGLGEAHYFWPKGPCETF